MANEPESRISMYIFGLLTSIKFYKMKHLAERFRRKYKNADVQSEALLETEWEEFVDCQKSKLRGEVWIFNDSAMAFVNGQYIGGCEEFYFWYENNLKLRARFPEMLFHDAAEEMRQRLRERNHQFAYLEIQIGENIEGILTFELFTDLLPRTCKNFIALCTGAKIKRKQIKLHYEKSPIHRIVPGGWIQGGDIVKLGSGNGGMSIYGPTFPDENFVISHDKFGVLGMANKGRHTNSSQFYVTLAPHKWMDNKMVAFGQLISGRTLMRKIESLPTLNERPIERTFVSECGIRNIEDIQMIDLTDDDLVLYHSNGLETPLVPVVIELPDELCYHIDSVTNDFEELKIEK